jgi:hypothetical protein
MSEFSFSISKLKARCKSLYPPVSQMQLSFEPSGHRNVHVAWLWRGENCANPSRSVQVSQYVGCIIITMYRHSSCSCCMKGRSVIYVVQPKNNQKFESPIVDFQKKQTRRFSVRFHAPWQLYTSYHSYIHHVQ